MSAQSNWVFQSALWVRLDLRARRGKVITQNSIVEESRQTERRNKRFSHNEETLGSTFPQAVGESQFTRWRACQPKSSNHHSTVAAAGLYPRLMVRSSFMVRPENMVSELSVCSCIEMSSWSILALSAAAANEHRDRRPFLQCSTWVQDDGPP
jgi:hypothetical protein